MINTLRSHWVPKNILDQYKNTLEQNIYHWLAVPNNLTEAIKKTDAQFSLTVLSQSFDMAYPDEHEILNHYSGDASRSLVRKVFLNGNNNPIVFSRVIIPEKTYIHYEDAFLTLGNNSIGNAILYAHKNIERTAFEYKCIDRTHPIFQELQDLNQLTNKGFYMARRSVFILPKGVLLITEIFLDHLPLYTFSSSN